MLKGAVFAGFEKQKLPSKQILYWGHLWLCQAVFFRLSSAYSQWISVQFSSEADHGTRKKWWDLGRDPEFFTIFAEIPQQVWFSHFNSTMAEMRGQRFVLSEHF